MQGKVLVDAVKVGSILDVGFHLLFAQQGQHRIIAKENRQIVLILRTT